MLSSFQRSMLTHVYSASEIGETEVENPFSNLSLLEVDTFLSSLSHLICLCLVFRLMCCNGFSLKPTGLMCDGCALSAFSLPGGSRSFSVVTRFDGSDTLTYLNRGVALHESSSCFQEIFLDDCGRPCDSPSCFLLSALWLRFDQSLSVQETQ